MELFDTPFSILKRKFEHDVKGPVLMVSFKIISHFFSIRPKKYMCVSGFSSEETRYGRLALPYYFVKIFYIEIAFFTTFSPIFPHICQYFACNLQ